jgi:ribosomal protein L3 glutamine methyltransferase
MTLAQLISQHAATLDAAGLSYGHGTTNAQDEAAWLVLWALGLPLDTDTSDAAYNAQFIENLPNVTVKRSKLATVIEARIATRKPAAYLTQEAWLQGVAFYVDERAIVPRSFIAELLVDESLDYWLAPSQHADGSERPFRILDLCTGNGSLAVIAAMAYPDAMVDAADLSADALEVAAINVNKHSLAERITLLQGDGLAACAQRVAERGPYDLILCNPPYVNATSMAALPLEYRAEPQMALASGADGMDFSRALLREAAAFMSENAVLVLEIGNERENFEHAFPQHVPIWLETSAGEDQVLLLTRDALGALHA